MWVALARGIILDSEAGNGLCNGFFMDDICSPDDVFVIRCLRLVEVRYGLQYPAQN